MSDEALAKELQQYKEIAAVNKNVDISALMLNALEKEQENRLTTRQKTVAYFVTVTFAPFGLIYAVKFYFSGASDGKKTALYIVIITFAVIGIISLMFNAIISTSGTSVQQIQTIKPDDIRSLLQ
ncbi:MAG: hypothetical protein JWO40_463 [Candidatus Doudnabacteria bacterium]|nr:hypothetical protein [Candidatus Doudnabacteria bacterium]